MARHGRLDALVNNHAISKHKHALHTSAEEAEQVLRVNFLSCVWTTYAALPVLLRQPGGGVIVNVSSFAAQVVPPREGLYAASKAALDAFTAGLWNDLAGSDVHVGPRDSGRHRHRDLGEGGRAAGLLGQEAPARRSWCARSSV